MQTLQASLKLPHLRFATLFVLSCHDCRQCYHPPGFHRWPLLWLSRRCPEVCFFVLDQITSISTTSNSFDSLFRVLFIFPSQYLFAIGFPSLFSLRWSIPPILSCTLKQLDSFTNDISVDHDSDHTTGVSPSMLACSNALDDLRRSPIPPALTLHLWPVTAKFSTWA